MSIQHIGIILFTPLTFDFLIYGAAITCHLNVSFTI